MINRENNDLIDKAVSTWDFANFLKMPDLKISEKQDAKFAELNLKDRDIFELKTEKMQNKPFNLFGYSFFDIEKLTVLSYTKDSKKDIKKLLEFTNVTTGKVKHNTENEFNVIANYQNFYPTEINFNNKIEKSKIRFNKNNSNYQTEFWKQKSFPDMKPIFDLYHKDDLKEKLNIYNVHSED